MANLNGGIAVATNKFTVHSTDGMLWLQALCLHQV
jgi:hypothetical protein